MKAEDEEAYFFEVPMWKLAVMSFCSLGLYEIFWFYRNWKVVKKREMAIIRPFWRAVFAIFFCYSCFSRIRESMAEESKVPAAGMLAAAYILISLTWRLEGAAGLLAMASFVFLLPVQGWATRVNEEKSPGRNKNDRLTWKNWLLVVTGGTLAVMNVLWTLFPEWMPEE